MRKTLQDLVAQCRPELGAYEDLYKHFHKHPQISTLEEKTADDIAAHLRKLSGKGQLDIRTKIGGHGLVATFKNGEGPTVLLRADIDGMGVPEKTGLPYASTAQQKDNLDGQTKSVMHACGHDVHLTSLLGATETLLAAKGSWTGTLIALFQPAEERGSGAQSMVDDGLFDANKHACPVPDICLAQHVYPERAGSVQTKAGAFFSAADSYRVTVYGRGGHGSMPHKCIDPVVIASHIIIRLQTIVSREIPPDETAVITVGSVQSGHTVNVISDEAVMQINIRSVSQKWRKVLLNSVERVVEAECTAGRCPYPPRFERLNGYPLTENDQDATAKLQKSFGEYFKDDHEAVSKAFLASEDFSNLARAVGKPYVYWTFGGIDQKIYDKKEKEDKLDELPINHSPYFAPAIQPTLQVGIDALTIAALTFLGSA